MKRSEMRNVIAEILHKNTRGIDGHPAQDTAQEILNQIEELGMSPPCIKPDEYDAGAVGSIIKFNCEWEKEK